MIKKQDLNKYTKKEIVEVLLSNQYRYNTSSLLGDLQRVKEKKAWKIYDEASKKYRTLLDEETKLLKELKAKYGDKSLLLYEKNDINRLIDLQEKIEKAKQEVDKANAEYERIYNEW